MIDDNNEGIWGDLDWQGLAWFSVPVAVAALCYFIGDFPPPLPICQYFRLGLVIGSF